MRRAGNNPECGASAAPVYSEREEWCNILSHAAGAGMVIGGFGMIFQAAWKSGATAVAAVAVYSVTLLAMYLASTGYHAAGPGRGRRFWRLLDHCAIYLLIAGTYTPLMLLALGGVFGISLLAGVWLLAALGVAAECLRRKPFRGFSLVLYLVMGWLCLIAFKPMIAGMTGWAFGFLVGGGVIYSLGVIFYARRRPFSHSIWHLFVLGGSSLHYLAIWNLL